MWRVSNSAGLRTLEHGNGVGVVHPVDEGGRVDLGWGQSWAWGISLSVEAGFGWTAGQMIWPGMFLWVTTGRPAAAQACMPPVRLLAV